MNTLAALAILLAQAAGNAPDEPAADAKPTGETRYSVSLADEGAFAGGLRIPGPDKGNLLLVQPSFAYRRGDRWRVSTSLALAAQTQGDTHARLRVKELYAGYSEGDFDFSAGKRLVRWGTGYAFTPTGILDPPRVATDPTDRLNLNEGREMVKADWIRGSNDVTLAWASAGLVTEHRPGMRETFAVRYNVLSHGFDTSWIIARDRGGPTFAGANFTRVFGQAVEAHGEFAYRDGAAVLLGGKYTLRSGLTVVGEFYTPPNTAYYRPAGMPATVGRQHYGFLRVSKSRLRELPGWKEWDLAASVVVNADDHSWIGVFDAERRFGNHVSAYAHALTPAGEQWRSQYGMLPYAALVSVGLRYQL
ncbi:MAG: hypothetical protein JSU00_08490 [Acidobacteria bacterium]|nr:hypothetical protein [Acidobacteriota bacterium]